MALKGFQDFLNSLGIDLTGKSSDSKIDPKLLSELFKQFEEFTKKMDIINDTIETYRKVLQNLISQQASGKKGLEEKIKEFTDSLNKAKEASNKVNEQVNEKIKEWAKENNLDPAKLKSALTGFDELNDGIENTGKSGANTAKIFQSVIKNLEGFSGSLTFLKDFLEFDFAIVIEMATKQIFNLNKALIETSRATGTVLNNRTLGFSESGNSATNVVGSVNSIAGTNGLDIHEYLQTFKAFADGNILGGVNFKDQQEQLQRYGVEVGRLNKLYGISEANTSSFARTLVEQYGTSIEDAGHIMEHGAEIAKAAGLNVGIFFDNLDKIAQLQGSLFIKGGAEGLTQAAFALSKLNLHADELTKLTEAYSGFTELVDKQQKATALGLQNIASVQNAIFAKVNLGDAAGAARLRQFAAAQDVSSGLYSTNGIINAQGARALQSAGYNEEEIKSIQRIINMQKQVGASFNDLMKETNLTTAQLEKKRLIETDQLSLSEKLNVLWHRIYAVFIEPFAMVLGPLLSFTIDTLSFTFEVLHTALKPVIWGVQIFGQALQEIADVFREAYIKVEIFAKKVADFFGLNSNAAGSILKVISEVLKKILEVLIVWKAWQMGQAAVKEIGNAISWVKDLKMIKNLRSLTGNGLGGQIINEIPGIDTKIGRAIFGSKGFISGEEGLAAGRLGGLFGHGGGVSRLGGLIKSGLGAEVGGASVGSMLMRGLKGAGTGLLISGAGDLLGSAVSGDAKKGSGRYTAGHTISGAATGAGWGFTVGEFLAPLTAGLSIPIATGLGALTGAIVSNWDGIKKNFHSWWENTSTTNKILETIAGPVGVIAGIISTNDKQDKDAKIASVGRAGVNPIDEVKKIMAGKKFDTSILEESEKENMVNKSSDKRSPINIHIKHDLAAASVRMTGFG